MLRCFVSLFVLSIATFPALAQNAAPTTAYAPADPGAAVNLPSYDLILEARLTAKGKPIEKGLVWRVFSEQPSTDTADNNQSKLRLIATGKGGTGSFSLPQGTYFVHASFGRAGATKRIELGDLGLVERFVLQAGGLRLDAITNNKEIPKRHLRFSIYEQKPDEDGNRKLIALNVPPDKIVRLNAGTYHVLSHYGDINASVRADLEVKAGKVTEAVMQHRGAEVTLKLVSEPGGTPVANTAWSVFTDQGEKVLDSNSASPSLVLAEGEYEAIAQNGSRNLTESFKVNAGSGQTVEVLLKK